MSFSFTLQVTTILAGKLSSVELAAIRYSLYSWNSMKRMKSIIFTFKRNRITNIHFAMKENSF